MTDKAKFLPTEVYQYLLSISSRETAVQAKLRTEISKLPGAQMAIPPEQAQLLQFLIKLIHAKNILEIGMFAGYSALAMALVLPKAGKLITCELDTQHEKLAREHWRLAEVEDRIDLRIGPALQTLEQLFAAGYQEKFDFIFIDADKTNYNYYYEKSLQLVKREGLIAIDNVLWMGRLVQHDDGSEATRALRELNKKIHTDKRVEMVTLTIGGGLTLVRKL
ncbi:MAG: SAM-dependent methyltransferase [Gammaproteobacteria bacterium RIFCSPHIGHO2_12_FULL_35_23]|nr:MAG: SAM-dependent methyltransferase [Gammaproteobacteria bacterium RIFCSPHIGHO2_12_FULL_35_23]